MGHVNEGGMHFIHYGKGIEKKEFEYDNNYFSKNKIESTKHPKTIVYKGKIYEVINVKEIKNSNENKKISPKKLKGCKNAIGYQLFYDGTGKKYICVLLMQKIFTGFTMDSFQRYVLRITHSFKAADITIEVAIDKNHSVPVRDFVEKVFFEIAAGVCWVSACIPIPKASAIIKNEKDKYRFDYSVNIDRGIKVRYQIILAEEEFNNTLIKNRNPLEEIKQINAERLFSLPGFNNYCEKL